MELKLRNFFNLYYGHVRGSRRTLMIASVGLILALTIVSSSNYYFDNSKKALIDNYFNDDTANSQGSDININFYKYLPFESNIPTLVNKTIFNTAEDYGIDYIKSSSNLWYLNNLFLAFNHSYFTINDYFDYGRHTVPVIQMNESLAQELNQINNNHALINNSEIPTNAFNLTIPEVFAVAVAQPNENFDFKLNNSKLTQLSDCLSCKAGINYSVQMSGAASFYPYANYFIDGQTPENPDFGKYPILSSLVTNYQIPGPVIFFTRDIVSFISILNQTLYSQAGPFDIVPSISYSFSITFDHSKIDPYQAQEIIVKTRNFIVKLQASISSYSDRIRNLFITFTTEYKFITIQGLLGEILASLLLVNIPVLLVTMFVINYSFGLINQNIVRHIGIYKNRGTRSWMIFVFQILDNLLIISGSVILGMILGVPLTILALQTDFLLSFNYSPPSYYVLNFIAVANFLLYTAVILTLLINTFRIIKLSRISIVDAEQPVEKGEPVWKRHYLDIILFGFGLVVYTVFFTLIKTTNLTNDLKPIIDILSLLMIPAPFALVIGIILVANRLIPLILNKIGTVLWIKTGDLIAFSFKNVIRHRQASTRAVMLIAILLAFMVFFYSVPYSDLNNTERTIYYKNGADAVGTFLYNRYNQTDINIIESNFSQYLDGITPYVVLSYTNSYYGTYNLMLVNTSTYLKGASLNYDLGLQNNLIDDLNNLKVINDSDSLSLNVIIDQQVLEDRKIPLGVNLQVPGATSILKLHSIDTFRNWPVLKAKFDNGINYLAIGNIDYYLNTINRNLTKSPFNRILDTKLLLNFKDGVNQTLVSSWIEKNTSISINTISEKNIKQNTSQIQNRLELGQINSDVLMVIVITVVVLIMFVYLQLTERKKEIFTERAIGMKLHQIAMLFFIETIILSVTSIIMGILMGGFLMELLALLIFNPLQAYPAYEILFPVDYITLTSVFILLASILVSIVPAIYVTKQDISKSFGEV